MSELKHWGIEKMRWGVRRYRNYDGTLTEAGKLRYNYDVSKNRQKKSKDRVDEEDLKDPNRWVREDLERSKSVIESTKDVTRNLSDLERKTRKKELARLDLSKMTEAEMRSKINRELLERQYNQLFNGQEISKGREKVADFLDKFGDVLAISASGVAIALGVKQLKG